MANNQAIRILRGSYDNIKQNSNEKPLYGQPIFDNTNNYLLIGSQDQNSIKDLSPITTNRLIGNYGQYPYNSQKNKPYCIEPNVAAQKLNIITENGVNILDSTDGKAIGSPGHLIAYGDSNYIQVDSVNGIQLKTASNNLFSSNQNILTASQNNTIIGSTVINADNIDKAITLQHNNVDALSINKDGTYLNHPGQLQIIIGKNISLESSDINHDDAKEINIKSTNVKVQGLDNIAIETIKDINIQTTKNINLNIKDSQSNDVGNIKLSSNIDNQNEAIVSLSINTQNFKIDNIDGVRIFQNMQVGTSSDNKALTIYGKATMSSAPTISSTSLDLIRGKEIADLTIDAISGNGFIKTISQADGKVIAETSDIATTLKVTTAPDISEISNDVVRGLEIHNLLNDIAKNKNYTSSESSLSYSIPKIGHKFAKSGSTNGTELNQGYIAVFQPFNEDSKLYQSDVIRIIDDSNSQRIIVQGQVQATSFIATSDKRLKENLKLYSCNKNILDLPIYEFDYKDSNLHTIGCLAQDLQEICPQIVHESDDGYLHIEESKLIYLLIQEVKELKQKLLNK